MDDAPGRHGWLAWPLLVLSALPLVVVAVVSRRVLSGDTMMFGELPTELPLIERVGLLLNVTSADGQLLAPLAGVAALGWCARRGSTTRPPVAAVWCGALVAAAVALLAAAQCALVGYLALAAEQSADDGGFYGGRPGLLEVFGPRTATALLVAALAAALAVGMVSTARRAAALPDDLAPEKPEPEPKPEADAPESAPVAPDPETDPHARFRRPS